MKSESAKLKKERAKSVAGAQTGGFWGLFGEGNREGTRRGWGGARFFALTSD